MNSRILKYKSDKFLRKINHLLAIFFLITFLTIIFIKTKVGDVLGERFKWFFQDTKSTTNFWSCSKFTVENRNSYRLSEKINFMMNQRHKF